MKIKLKRIIKEELRKLLNEYTIDSFQWPSKHVDIELYNEMKLLLPKSYKSTNKAKLELRKFIGKTIWSHVYAYWAIPKNQSEDFPKYRLVCHQLYMRDTNLNVADVQIIKYETNTDYKTSYTDIYFDNKIFLSELNDKFLLKSI